HIRSRWEGLVESQSVSGEAGARNQADDRFGNDAAEGLIEAGDLAGFEPDAGVMKHAAQRAGIDSAQMRVPERTPYHSHLGGDLVNVAFSFRDGRGVNVQRIMQMVIADSAGKFDLIKQLQ